ncbi:RBBP9/YdeN family alpha/beta hydrolase [Aeromonas tecta]|uniref:RBBP9/YdeN family alpha/beta hydrolase n=1 Tax=Aeromonas tecta TaxID=324617 RepID=UPI00068090EC|nr:alpha/beta hydrolase [Aeromonas tecta]
MKVLILPGIGNSGPDHWQSHWERTNGGYSRVEQLDWDSPACSDWVASLEASVKHHGEETILVAHSLACLLVAHWAARTELTIKAALLVAVPDPQGPVFPTQATGFAPLPMASLPFKSILIASADDPYGDIAHSALCAASWGSTLVNIGEAGHINGASGLGAWPAGYQWLQELAMA